MVLGGACLLVLSSYLFFQDEKIAPPENISEVIEEKKTIYINNQGLNVEIADEPREQSQGLSGRASLGDNEGMLFVFTASHIASFWMKDMNFSIDMIWIDEYGKIVGITKNISPDTFPQTFSPSSPIKYVLEVNAGWSDKNNVEVGDYIDIE